MEYKIQDTTLTSIASAVRSLTGTSNQMSTTQMVNAMQSLPQALQMADYPGVAEYEVWDDPENPVRYYEPYIAFNLEYDYGTDHVQTVFAPDEITCICHISSDGGETFDDYTCTHYDNTELKPEGYYTDLSIPEGSGTFWYYFDVSIPGFEHITTELTEQVNDPEPEPEPEPDPDPEGEPEE